MSKLFKKFSTRLFVGIIIFVISIVSVILLILRISNESIKSNMLESYDEVENKVKAIANSTWNDNYISMMMMVANEEVKTIDYVFDSIKLDLEYIAAMATNTYEEDKESNIKVYPPDKTKDGIITAQLTFEPDVDQNSASIKKEVRIIADLADDLINNIEYSTQIPRCYIVTDTGIMLMADRTPSTKFDEDGNLIKLTHRDKIWYKNSMATSSVLISDVVEDVLTKNDVVVLLKSFEVNGKKKGVVAFEMFTKMLTESDFGINVRDDFDVYVFDRNGSVVFSDNLVENEYYYSTDNIKDYAISKLNEPSIIGNCILREKECIVYNKSFSSRDWVLLVLVDKEVIKVGTQKLSNLISDSNDDLINDFDRITNKTTKNLTLLTLLILFISFFVARFISDKLSKPLYKLTSELNNSDVEHIEKVSTDYSSIEYANLASTFNRMIDRINEYLNNIKSITSEKEKIKAELGVAKKIQQNMLPKNFDIINTRKDINISAINIPEIEVGGDFYNYILINNKLYLIIADVSGSGIPASLFMAKTNSLINSAIRLTNSPKVILSYVNSELYKRNEENYFVTIGIYYIDLNTKKIISTNAGHENPIVIKNSGEVFKIDEKKTAPIGVSESIIFEENTIELEEGDTLFLYTDGVVEAINDKEELYGEERLLNELTNCNNLSAKEIIDKVKNSVQTFSNVPEQYDDITMLCFKFNKINSMYDENKLYTFEKVFRATYESIEDIDDFIKDSLEKVYLNNKEKYESFLNRISVCTEEIVVNIVDYAYKDIKVEDLKIIDIFIEIDLNDDKISIIYIDNGPEFDPTTKDDPNILKSAKERRIGGLGIYITKQVVDSMEYTYLNNQNRLKLVKYFT